MKTKQKLKFKNKLVLFSALFLILLATALSAETTYWIGEGVNLSIDPDNALFVDTTNNRIGIGTSSPSQPLEVEGIMRSGGSNAGLQLESRSGGSDEWMWYSNSGNLYAWEETSGEVFTIQNTTGNVGIGTSSPQRNFHIWDSNAGTDPSWTSGTDLMILESSSSSYAIFFTPNSGASGIIMSDPDRRLSGSVLYLHNEDKMNFRTNGSTNVVIDGQGNVGIGTTSPVHKLQVDDASDEVSLTVGEEYTSSTNASGFSISPWSDGSVYLDTKLNTGGKINFRYGEGAEAGSANTWMVVDGGDVGIGTTSPDYKLEVINTAGTAILGNSTGYAAYGVYGVTHGNLSYGVYGEAYGSGGQAIRGVSYATDGYSGYFTGGKGILVGQGNITQAGTGGDILITGGGSMGIGTSTPAYSLEVKGTGVRVNNSGELVYIGDNPSYPSIELRDTDGDGLGAFIDLSNDAAVDYDIRIASWGNDYLSIEGGNLGIGDTSPDYSLDVESTNGIAIVGTTTVDYGVYGFSSDSSNGRGVYGYNNQNSATAYGVYGLATGIGRAGYFTGGYGLRVNPVNFERSSIGDMFACRNGGTRGSTCTAVCSYAGLSCYSGYSEGCVADRGCWWGNCGTTCANAASDGVHMCWCQ